MFITLILTFHVQSGRQRPHFFLHFARIVYFCPSTQTTQRTDTAQSTDPTSALPAERLVTGEIAAPSVTPLSHLPPKAPDQYHLSSTTPILRVLTSAISDQIKHPSLQEVISVKDSYTSYNHKYHEFVKSPERSTQKDSLSVKDRFRSSLL